MRFLVWENAGMAQPLEGITVAILEHRFTKEFAILFEKSGATVHACPMLEEKPVENREELQHFVRRVVSGDLDAMIFLTGVGARFLVAEAESMGRKENFLEALGKMTIVVRGPKPVAALRQLGVHIDVIPENPTTEGVIEALRNRDLQGRRVGVQLYGTPNPQLVSALEAKGATVTPVQVYAYGAASDAGAVSALISRILDGQIQVVAFTSAPQVQMLFDFATQLGVAEALEGALKSGVTIASIGEVTSRALAARNLTPKIAPGQSKMGALAQAVAEHFRKSAR
jgi:uroporphyrinogen-III synthase